LLDVAVRGDNPSRSGVGVRCRNGDPQARSLSGGLLRIVALSLCLIVLSSSAVAQEASTLKTLASAAETRKLTEHAMGLVKQEKFAEAYASVKPFWPLPAIEIDGMANQMNTQWPMVQQRFGKSLDTEFVNQQKVGESFIRYTYLQKFERHAIRWTFVFYKPKDQWIVNAVSWDDGVNELFE
jgi:hypothetical protein